MALTGWLMTAGAQEGALKLSAVQAERIFLEQNLLLLAERMNVEAAEAAVVQAGLWDNPELSVGDINFWQEGEPRQFSVELSQMISTGGKRGRLVGREKVSREIALLDFEIVLLEMKAALRETVYEMAYLQSCRQALELSEQSLRRLIEACRKQLASGNISGPELLRLESALLELASMKNGSHTAFREQQRKLRSLLNLKPNVDVVVDEPDTVKTAELPPAEELLQMALEGRPDLKQAYRQRLYHEKSLAYERAMRLPDLNLRATYDRYGGVWRDFAGVGISFDLPLPNRNQGNIRAAAAAVNRSDYLLRNRENMLRNEVDEALANYSQASAFYAMVSNNELFGELDAMLEVYARRLLSKDIGMPEYIDFLYSYKTNKEIMFSARKQLLQAREQLRLAVGSDI